MRKICIFVLVVFLVGAMAVPALATSIETVSVPLGDGRVNTQIVLLPAGDYSIDIFLEDGTEFYSFDFFYEGPLDIVEHSFYLNYSGTDYKVFFQYDCGYFWLEVTDLYGGSPDFICNGTAVLSPYAAEALSPIDGITSVFSQIGSFVAFALGSLVSIFWTGQNLTFIGVLAVCGLCIAIILLLVYLIVKYMRF